MLEDNLRFYKLTGHRTDKATTLLQNQTINNLSRVFKQNSIELCKHEIEFNSIHKIFKQKFMDISLLWSYIENFLS